MKEAKRSILKKINLNIKAKHDFDAETSIFSYLKIFPQDVYNDSNEDNIVAIEESKPKIEKKKKKINKQLFSWLFILLNIIIVAVIFIKNSVDGGVRPISELFAEGPYYRFLFVALGLMCLILIIEGYKLYLITKNATGQRRPWLSLKVAINGRYWDCLTPFGSGGQPFQIYYLSKNGFSADTATGIPLTRHLFWQVSFCIISIIVVILPVKIANVGSVVKYLAWLGIAGNILMFSFILLMSVNNKLGGKILTGILKLLKKVHIIKNYDKAYAKSHETFANYQTSIKKSLKSPVQLIVQILLAILNIVLNALIAYFIYLAFNYAAILEGATPTSWVEIVCLSILCEAAVSLFPLPGGSGAAELSFIGLFGLLFKDDMRFWAMLFWRLFTYYGIIIIGLIFTISDSIVASKQHKKNVVDAQNISIEKEE